MNLAHVHLMLNHVPTIGFAIGIGLFLIALVYKDDRLQRVSLGLIFLIALLSLPVYLTGVAAAEMLEGREGVSAAMIRGHEDAALSAFAMMEMTGGAAWLALWQFRRFSRPLRSTVLTVAMLSIASLALMAYAANIGGGIRHPEILSVEEATETPSTTAWLRTAAIRSFVNDAEWVWPASEAIHFLGLALSFGVVLLLNLRMLGMMKSVPFVSLHRTLPWGMVGFAMNLVTGMMFFIGVPAQYTTNVSFHWKVLFLVLVGAHLLYFTSYDDAWEVGADQDAPPSAKVIAASTICLWVGVVYFGRMLPYLGNAY